MAIRDLTGCRFGMLVALEATAERKDECVVWRCRCDCGKEIFVSSNKLRQQRITSCGCTPKQKSKRNVYGEDLTGVQFGRWWNRARSCSLLPEIRIKQKLRLPAQAQRKRASGYSQQAFRPFGCPFSHGKTEPWRLCILALPLRLR